MNWCVRYSVICMVMVMGSACTDAEDRRQPPFALYTEEPEHPWNRLHTALFVRHSAHDAEYDSDALEVMLWPTTRHLLEGPSHDRTIAALDEFLSQRAELLIDDPLPRAMLQHDLWTLFDWTAIDRSAWWGSDGAEQVEAAAAALRGRVARVLRRLALDEDQIPDLPDTYAATVAAGSYPAHFDPDRPDQPFLPADLFDEDGPWVSVSGSTGTQTTAPSHVRFFSGRSTFQVFLRLPDGREATLEYLKQLQEFERPLIPNPRPFGTVHAGGDHVRRVRNEPFVPNPDLPQFPVDTQVALVRRMMVINDRGRPVATPIVQSVQLRVYREIPSGIGMFGLAEHQAFVEFQLSRQRLLSGDPGMLRALGRREQPTGPTFMFITGGNDPFETPPDQRHVPEPRPVMQSCISCHGNAGIHSVLTYSQAARFGARDQVTPQLTTRDPNNDRLTRHWKQQQFNWGLLQGLLEVEQERSRE